MEVDLEQGKSMIPGGGDHSALESGQSVFQGTRPVSDAMLLTPAIQIFGFYKPPGKRIARQ